MQVFQNPMRDGQNKSQKKIQKIELLRAIYTTNLEKYSYNFIDLPKNPAHETVFLIKIL
jgi:hypothetical protein